MARDPAGCESSALNFCLLNTLVNLSHSLSLTAAQFFGELDSVPGCGLVQYRVFTEMTPLLSTSGRIRSTAQGFLDFGQAGRW